MGKILISNSFPSQPILRQVPRHNATWCRHQFELDDGTQESSSSSYDAWVVYDDLLRPTTRCCNRNRTILFTGEPPSVRRYRPPFTVQFAHIRTSHRNIKHVDAHHGHEAQPWHYGLFPCQAHSRTLDYDDIATLTRPNKPKLLSVIASNKVITEDHRQRLNFVEQLKSVFGDEIDVFGRGIRDIPDKADAIWNYQYHIVLENDHTPFYMSEKLPDAFLGWSYPFYSGGPHADSVFPTGSFGRIDMYSPTDSIKTIQQAIESNTAERQRECIAAARSIVLDKLNLMAVLCEKLDEWEQSTEKKPSAGNSLITLYPKKQSVRLTMRRLMRSLCLST